MALTWSPTQKIEHTPLGHERARVLLHPPAAPGGTGSVLRWSVDAEAGAGAVVVSGRSAVTVVAAVLSPLAGLDAAEIDWGALEVEGAKRAAVSGPPGQPLLVFARPLHRARLRGTLEYGGLAGELGLRFEERWLRRERGVGPESLEANDFSATTDLYSVSANVWRMRVIPVTLRDILAVVVASLLPFVPFALLVVPPDQILKAITGLLL